MSTALIAVIKEPPVIDNDINEYLKILAGHPGKFFKFLIVAVNEILPGKAIHGLGKPAANLLKFRIIPD